MTKISKFILSVLIYFLAGVLVSTALVLRCPPTVFTPYEIASQVAQTFPTNFIWPLVVPDLLRCD